MRSVISKVIIFVCTLVVCGVHSYAAETNFSIEVDKDTSAAKNVSKGIFLSIEDQQLMDLAFSVAEISNYFAKSYLDEQGALIFMAGNQYITDRKIDVRIFDFLSEEQRNSLIDETANHPDCYIRKHFFGMQSVVIGIANLGIWKSDENRKCMILTFAYFAGQSVEDLQILPTKEIIPLYFTKLLNDYKISLKNAR
ncbi:MAG: hypothetical protein ABJN11_05820 [Lentilitoribacter sp.]